MARGRSLHIGLNRIDPAHYGSDGALGGCLNDARDMGALAESQGYDPRISLLDDKATVSAVKAAINEASAALEAGDIFLMTYAGHGGQVPDTNGDEGSDELGGAGDAKDETWCLFDRMLIDDELYSGCMDNQTSADGDGNGRFTAKLKGEWAGGAFRGPLKLLRTRIVQKMPSDQTPNYFVVGQPDRVFEKAQAFAI
jgi:hypothetical protein